MARRVYFTAWGRRANQLNLPEYAVRRDDGIESESEAVCRAIAQKTHLSVITCRSDGYSLWHGKPHDAHYQLTLGRPCPGGGWIPECELWIAIPMHA